MEANSVPILPEYEQRLSAAALSGNQDDVDRIQDEYNKAREDEISRIESRSAAKENEPQEAHTLDVQQGAGSGQDPNGMFGQNQQQQQQES